MSTCRSLPRQAAAASLAGETSADPSLASGRSPGSYNAAQSPPD